MPWNKFASSIPVWAIIVVQVIENWGWYTLLSQLPTYLTRILRFNLQESGFAASLPYLALMIIVQCAGRLADFLRWRRIMSTTAVRKLFNSIGFLSQGLFLVMIGYTEDKNLAIVGFTLAVGIGGFAWSAFAVNYLDIAPRYASILFGIGNCLGTVPGIISPLIVGFLTENEEQQEWRNVFFIAAAIYLFGLIFYALFASGEKQEWADTPRQYFDEDDEEGEELLSGQR